MAIILDGVVSGPTGYLNGAQVDAWTASRFTSIPAAGDPPPAGQPDAGPVLSGTTYGGPGQWRMEVPAVAAYYVRVTYPVGATNAKSYWAYDDSLVLTTGPQGVQGVQGYQGYQGNQGPQGTQGTQGVQGSVGFTGPQGFQGSQGPQGNMGAQGVQGTQGTQGYQGFQGNQGLTGPQGYQGNQGAQGNQGPQAASDFYNVKNYGAVGNGSTDDTAAIQSAINAATFGGVIFFPPGRYIVSSTLNLLVDGTEIVGSGNSVNGGTVIKAASSFTSGDVFYLNNKTGRNFRDFSIQYTTAPTSGYAINQAAGGGDSIENVRISWYNGINSNGHVLNVNNCDITAINDCFVQTAGIMRVSDVIAGHTAGSTGIGFKIDKGANTTRIVTSQTQKGGYGILFTNSVSPGTDDPTFLWTYDLEINDPTIEGIYLQYGHEVYITNAWISGANVDSGVANGINVAATFVGDVNVSNSQIQDMPGHGILLQGGSGYQISNSQIGGCSSLTTNTYDAIHVSTGCTKVMLSAIQTDSTPYYGKTSRYGLYVESGATVWRDSVSVFAGITGSVFNAGTINSYLQGNPVSSAAPSSGQALIWNGSSWAPSSVAPTVTYAAYTASGTAAANEYSYISTNSGIVLTLPASPAVGTINYIYAQISATIKAPTGVNICQIAGAVTGNTYATVGYEYIILVWNGTLWQMIGNNHLRAVEGVPANAIPYGSSSNNLTTLAANTTTTPKFLSSTGTGSASNPPALTSSTGIGDVVLSGSPTLTGVPLAPTATLGTNTQQIATTAFVAAAVSGSQGPQGAQGAQGNQGFQGTQGTQGTQGPGVPTGGTTGQALIKNSGTNYDTGWQSQLPLSGGTMSGNINLNSVARLTNLLRPSGLGEPMRVNESMTGFPLVQFLTTNTIIAATLHPDYCTTQIQASTPRVAAIYVPYDVTATGVRFAIQAAGTSVTAGAVALMNATTTLAAASSSAALTAMQSSAGVVTVAFSSTVALTAGTYWIVLNSTATTNPYFSATNATATGITSMGQSVTTNSLATTRAATITSIPAIGSSLAANPTSSTTQIFAALY